jgi:catechol 2,3-dioxygenase-like lactoylglutathione lyase family enzyme
MVKMAEVTTMAKVIGIGGVFLHCADVEATKDWYARVLGMEPNDFGGFHFMHGESAAGLREGARTIYGIFAAETDYFAPSTLPFMLNLMVDDLDGVLARVAEAGVEEVQERQDSNTGASPGSWTPTGASWNCGSRRAARDEAPEKPAFPGRICRQIRPPMHPVPACPHHISHISAGTTARFRVKLKHSTRDQPARVSRHTGNHKSENQEQGSNGARAGNMTEMAHGTIVVQSGEAVLPRWWRTVDGSPSAAFSRSSRSAFSWASRPPRRWPSATGMSPSTT